MPSASYIVILSAGEPEAGLWCDACLLPSRVRIPIVMITETGASDTAIAPADACTECGKRF